MSTIGESVSDTWRSAIVEIKATVRSTAIMEASSFVLKHPEMDSLQLAEALLQLSLAPKGEA